MPAIPGDPSDPAAVLLTRQRRICDSREFSSHATVIRETEAFLRDHPTTALRKDLLYHLALAYETWWSLEPAEDRARTQALAAYEEILRIAPDSSEAHHARQVRARLKLGLHTGERRFICSIG